MTRLQGSWPGGPSRKVAPSPPEKTFRTDSLERRAQKVDEARERSVRKRRSKRMAMTLAATAVFATVIGVFVGLRSHQTREDLARAREEAARGPASGIVEELLEAPAVREMLQGERVEAAAARANR